METRSRRGRPRAGEVEARRSAVLDATLAELVEHGYERLTTSSVAQRAGVSKESLYSWFGDREGLLDALIRRAAAPTEERLAAALAPDAAPATEFSARVRLTGIARSLIDLLLSPGSVAINRAAMSSPALSQTLLQGGRHTTGPLVEAYLGRLHEAGVIRAPDPGEAFQLLYGLVIQDLQIRALLGEDALPQRRRAAHAANAVGRFLILRQTPPRRPRGKGGRPRR